MLLSGHRRQCRVTASTYPTSDRYHERVPALTEAEKRQFETEGYVCPVPVLTPAEVEYYLARYHELREWTRERLDKLPPKDRFKILHETHLVMPWIHELVSHPKIVEVIASLLGDNVVVWNSVWFAKDPKDKAYTSWHQDGTYWNFTPPVGITAWVALTESQPSNGCVRVIPRTHSNMLAYRETFAEDNLLSRGQEIENVDESRAVDLALQPGQMSLHEFWMVHGSQPNSSGVPRIGLAIRYTRPDVKGPRFLVSLVSGVDQHGNFEIVPPPTRVPLREEYHAIHDALAERVRAAYGLGKIT